MPKNGLVVRSATVFFLLAATASCGGGAGGGPDGGNSGPGTATVRTLAFPDGVRGGSPRFSPDGALLAYVRSDGTGDAVAVMTTAGGDSRTLATDASYLTAMTWPAAGTEVIYAGDNGIRSVPLDGGPSRFIVDAFAAVAPDLSPDGSALVYGTNGSTMRLLDLKATPPMESDLGVVGGSPRFSPDGGTIAFWGDGKIALMNVATRSVSDVLASDNSFGGVDWFADGHRLLAGTDRGIEIVTLDAAMAVSGRTVLKDAFALLDVDLSPDGRSVAYGVNGASELYVLSGF